MIITLLNSLLIGILFADFLERRFNEPFYAFFTEVAYNSIYLYSKAQIIYNKLNLNKLWTKQVNQLDVIKNGVIMNNHQDVILKTKSPMVVDFILYSWSSENGYINKQVQHDFMSIKQEESNVSFLLVEIDFRENKYFAKLKSEEYNYYIVGNVFNKTFFIYFLKNHLDLTEITSDDKIIVKIVDQNIETFNLDFNNKHEGITLRKNEYIVNHTSCHKQTII